MELLRPPLIDARNAVVAPRTIVLRNDGAVRRLEQLPESVSVAQGHIDGPVTLEENGARFFADLEGGQKTGWFYDQRDNRTWAARFARDVRVLDGYAFAGGFAVQAALAGARSEEHTSELQSLMRISYAVFCLKKKKNTENYIPTKTTIQ